MVARSRGHRPSSRKGRKERIGFVRIAIAIVALVLGLTSVISSFARVAERLDPGNAYAIDGRNGKIVAAYAKQRFLASPTGEDDSIPALLARRALISDATAVDGVIVLALQAQISGNSEGARDLFAYALDLSRRDFRAHIWAIEEAVSRGDINGALTHYDLVLKTSQEGAAILLPNLVSALREPKVRASLLSMIERQPPWKDRFLARAVSSTTDPLSVRAFINEGRAAGIEVSDDMKADLVASMVRAGKLDDAWEYYRTFRTGSADRSSRDGNFTADLAVRTPFDWSVTADPSISSAIVSDDEGGYFEFSAPPGRGGAVLSQMQTLAPGAYRLRWSVSDIREPGRASPYWIIACRGGRELARFDVSGGSENLGQSAGRFQVTRDCPVQTLSLVLRSTDDISGVSGRISSAQISPAG